MFAGRPSIAQGRLCMPGGEFREAGGKDDGKPKDCWQEDGWQEDGRKTAGWDVSE